MVVAGGSAAEGSEDQEAEVTEVGHQVVAQGGGMVARVAALMEVEHVWCLTPR